MTWAGVPVPWFRCITLLRAYSGRS
jgi:hypothetical protein